MRHEAALGVVENTEVLAGLRDGDDVLEAEREAVISSGSVVNLDIGILVSADFEALLAGECVLESVAEQHREGNALTQLVGARRGALGVHTDKFVQAPVGGCEHTLHMLLGSSCLYKNTKISNHSPR